MKTTNQSGEYVSKATTECANADRSISAPQVMSRRKIGTKADLLFTTQFFEFGTCEAGKTSDITSTKTLQEAGIKIPRTLKDMLYVLSNECPNQLRQLKTCGLAISDKSYSLLKYSIYMALKIFKVEVKFWRL
ncbi:hypothetical protein BDA99DRAFT_543525 [Phascolomyces articulosus]|uniref:Uncharacterized protein n=1 Tax=Phascolomyces articulosus TaxID=60185 RepID=A0AAD5JN94_9FUNG|nr:hypothetical protein BDA99DRAFT_543525 [Phascolomyces articulosus]